MQRLGFKSALGYLLEAFLFKIKASKDSVCKMRVSLKMQLISCSVIYSRKEYIVLFNYFLKKCGCVSFCTLFPPAATNRIEFCGKPCSDQGTVPPCVTSH